MIGAAIFVGEAFRPFHSVGKPGSMNDGLASWLRSGLIWPKTASGEMLSNGDLASWLRLFESSDPMVRFRAGQGLLRRSSLLPLKVLLQVLQAFEHPDAAKMLLARQDPNLFDEMTDRLKSSSPYLREVACRVIGELDDSSGTSYLMAALDDDDPWVSRAAAVALAVRRDQTSVSALLRRYELCPQGSSLDGAECALRLALEYALTRLGVKFGRRSR